MLIDLDKLATTLLDNFLLVAAVGSMFYRFYLFIYFRREYVVNINLLGCNPYIISLNFLN